MKKILEILKYQLPALLWAIFIFWLCTSENKELTAPKFFNIPHLDKIAHIAIFLILGYLLMRGFKKSMHKLQLPKNGFIVALILCAAYGLFIELFQHYYTATRVGDGWDFVADMVGACIGLFICKTQLFRGGKNMALK